VKSSTLPDQPDGWETIASEPHFQNAHLAVVTDHVRSPTRPDGRRWTVVQRKAAVIIAPMTEDDRLVMIRQERIPIRSEIWEVPGGQIDDAGELDQSAVEAVGLNELRDETGYELAPGGELIPLGDFFSSPGFTDEHSYFFLARPVIPSAAGHAHQDSESISDCRTFTPAELAAMIARNEIRDANTLGMCAKLAARGFISLQA
jgi:ADP-ribose pyrophosphatase